MRKLLMAGVLGVGMLSGFQAAWAQSADPEVQQLEEQVRQLNGRIEEMSFQLLQMQEQLRKAQEDNEFRFQELEKGGGGAKKSGALEQPAGADGTATADAGTDPADAGSAAGDDVAKIIGQPGGQDAGSTDGGVGQLGSIEMDASGNPVKATIDPGAANGGNAAANQTASTGGSGGSEGDSYQIAYSHVLSGDYSLAEQEFRSYIANYPQGKKIADANFWLGEAYYSQGKYNEAAKTFLKAHQTYGKSPKAPEMLLKLGMSLAALDNNDTACATLREVSKRYPKASRTVINKVASEQKRLGC
ncbi:tol-pal system protein YbgF [Gellertiella hungarica]|uniref:Cell division coordinator CpoB n=1 Tax=Gellertiella hungarica TaxID=1572859 RepID=A0A7W6J382_9HYPH|nr:tol-pal system protein YbgF [Gellertiella hungarica]MBB4063171.1 tol-pal system protein YbgF [Gellertiella hungarica]